MQITQHLNLAELTRSETAKRKGISNMPTPEHLENIKNLAINIFEPIRRNFGQPIHISSGYRSKELNTAIGGSLTSQHCSGEAIDIDMDNSSNGITNKQVFDYIKQHLNFDQLIWEFGTKDNPDWIHVSYKTNGKQRKQVLRAVKQGSKTTYIPYV
jgi:zinc D-Ala-D-Ala carboxypeptidase